MKVKNWHTCLAFVIASLNLPVCAQGVMITNDPSPPVPSALLHILGLTSGDGNVLFTGEYKSNISNQGDPPTPGPGTRLMRYPDKAAFRAGRVMGTTRDKASIGNYSVAAGLSTTASGVQSAAPGGCNTALIGTLTQNSDERLKETTWKLVDPLTSL
ncbi:hypothetical protein DSECCO2_306220 [anaerobic digester metagenome]